MIVPLLQAPIFGPDDRSVGQCRTWPHGSLMRAATASRFVSLRASPGACGGRFFIVCTSHSSRRLFACIRDGYLYYKAGRFFPIAL